MFPSDSEEIHGFEDVFGEKIDRNSKPSQTLSVRIN
jgi:hypothetical protein